MGANEITKLPEGIFDLKQLKTLKITGLRDTIGCISSNLGKLKKLEFLEIDGTVDIPESIRKLKRLKEFRMQTKYKTNRPSKAIFSLPKLEYLYYYAYEPTHLDGIGQLQSLRVLKLSTDVLPPEIGELKNLEGLSISGFKGAAYPETFAKLKKLQALQISRSDSIRQAPAFIPELPVLRYLQINACAQLSSFGPSFFKMKQLEEVHLSYNPLIREVPESLGHLKDKVRIKNSSWGRRR